MAQRTGADIIFASGIDESMDDKVRPAEALKTARNVVYNYDGLLEKRHGFDNVSLSSFDYDDNATETISPTQLFAINNELIAYANAEAHSALSAGSFFQRDRWRQVAVESRHVAANGGRVSSFDQAYVNGYDVYAWCAEIGASSVPYLFAKIVDRTTGAVLHSDLRLRDVAADAAYACRLVVLGNYAVCVFYDNATLYAKTINLASATPQWSAEQTLYNNLSTTYNHGIWDAREIEGSSSAFNVAYYRSAGANEILVGAVSNSGGTLTAGATTAQSLVGGGVVARGIGIRSNVSDDRVYVAVAIFGAATELQVAKWDDPAVTPAAVSGFTAIGGGGAVIAFGVQDLRYRVSIARIAANDVLVAASAFGAPRDTWYARTTDFLSPTPQQYRLADHDLLTRIIELPAGRFLACLRYADAADGTQLLVDLGYPFGASSTANTFTGYGVARMFGRQCVQGYGVVQTASTPSNTTNTYDLPSLVTLFEDARADLHSATVRIDPVEGVQAKQIDGLLYTGGGWPAAYDGDRVIELGYNHPPPDFLSTNVGSGGNMVNGAYQWAAHYEWLDARGKIHRSPVTYSQSTNITSANGLAGSCNLTISPVNLTQRSDEEKRDPKVYVAIYRTAVNSTDSYTRLFTGAVANVFCEANQANIAYQDMDVDTAIANNEPLYTDADALEPQGAPATSAICVHQGRLFGISYDASIWYSTEAVDEEPVSYNDAQTIAEFEGGKAVALASLDNCLLVLKKSSIWAILGEGPDNTGAGAGFSKPVRIASDIGCNDWRSVLETPKGVMFYGAKGLQLVNRAKEVVWVGKRVRKTLESYPVVTNAVLHPTSRWALFSCKATETSSSGVILCYDLERDAWTTWDIATGSTQLRAPKSMAVTSNNLYVLTPDAVLKSNSTNYRDNGVWATMNIETGQLKPGLQGYALLRKVWVLGTRSANAGLNVQVARNFSSTYDTFVASYTDAQLLSLERDQWRVAPEKKKGMSFQLKLTDFDPSAGNGQGIKVQGISVDMVPIGDKFQLTSNGAQR